MALTPGTRLGAYEITALIGEGGMGAVYRGTDTTLSRHVAIKILPDGFAADPERLARFEREAKTLASLNHPHIAAIYGFEKSGGTHALVMELVEGEDLSQRIARGAVPLDEALPIAKQIAEALEAAHEQGIIHRDLKPANIKVRSDGTVKVLDFGLAKAMDPATGSSLNISQSPTITTPAMTQAGMILGTAAYMSPEQARGTTVDKRADLWAFGVVLWEMLTGKRLFEGATVSDTLAAVLKTEPQWNALAPLTPAAIRRLLHRCLEKDRKRRFDSAADARLEIEDALTISSTADGAAGPATSSAPPGRLAWITALAVGVVIIALAIPAFRHVRETPPAAPPETRTEIVTPATDRPADFALSPDGRQIVFVAPGDGASGLWLRSLATTTAQPLAGTEGAALPFWSPDSRSVGFFADGKLKRLDLGGGAPQTLVIAVARGGTWSPDGVVLFAQSLVGPLFSIPASGGATLAVTKNEGHWFPQFLPGGRQFLFYVQGTADAGGIYLGSLDTPETTRLTAADTGGSYMPSGPRSTEALREGGWLLWVRAGALVAQRLDVKRRELVGEPVTLGDRVGVDTANYAGANAGAFSVSMTGLVAFRSSGANQTRLSWFDRTGKLLGTIGPSGDTSFGNPHVSPDGRRVAAQRYTAGNSDIWLLDGGRTSRFTFDAASDGDAVWSPGGDRLVFDSTRKGRRDLYQKASGGAGLEQLLVESPQDKIPTDWSADGRFILYHSSHSATGWDLWVLPLEGDRTPWVFLKTEFHERWAQFSPNGRWVAYMSNESGRMEIYVRPFAPPVAAGTAADRAAGQWQVSTTGGIFPKWRPDGRELYYVGPDGQMMAAPLTATGAVLTPGTPVVLFKSRIVGGGVDNGPRQYDVSPDGRFLINTLLSEAATAPITLLQNWQPEAKK